ncbi:helix-turn-helix domain-containing protein [Streptomyces kanamyceticus]|uniref:Transcriptional regulator n=1 Tax=Streptomyces kanamyceticus TaxID=1967 RepID=A0A5J6GBM3_STRKN|nr:helix-turn-helix domain-containing protein [Streptomyces kanamyceticus]QEU92869.1 transcriptional regulator [Streptomyces kanamyceticus]
MGQRPNDLTPDASPWHQLGAEMRAWRTHRRLSLGKLEQKIRFTPSYMARVERGEQAGSGDLVASYDRELDAGGSLIREYNRITGRGGVPDPARVHVSNPGLHVSKTPVSLVGDAGTEAPSSEGISVPVRTDDGRIIHVSLSRRAMLGALGSAAALSAIPEVATAVSIRTPRPPSGMNPIEHFQATRRVLIDNDNLFGAHNVIPIVKQQIAAIKELREQRRRADRRALIQLQTQFSELCGWLTQDIGDFRASQHWMQQALEASHMSGDPDLTNYILARRSQLAGDMHDAIEAVDVAEAAEDMATPRSRLAAVAATYGAHGYALRGEKDAAQRAYEHAHELRQTMDPDPASPWGVWLDVPYIEVQRAHSLSVLGDYSAAAEGFHDAIAGLPPGFHRDRGVYLSRAAVAHAGAGEPEQAATTGLEALNIGLETGSARISRELAQLDSQLNQWRTVAGVTDFKEAMSEAVLRQA